MRWLRWSAGLAAGGAAIWVVAAAAGGIADAGRRIEHADLGWVAVAVALEATSYFLIGAQFRRLLAPVATRRLGLGLGLVVSGFGLLTPASPVEGLALAGRELRYRGVDRRVGTLALGFHQWFSLRAFVLVAALNAWVAVLIGDLRAPDAVPVAIAAGVAVIVLGGTARLALRPRTAERAAVMLGAARFWGHRSTPQERRAAGAVWHQQAMRMAGSPANRARLAGLAIAAVTADFGCLYASLQAAGVALHLDIAALAVTAAALATALPLVPGGIGLAEAAIPAVLHHFGAPLDASLAGAVLYRAAGTFLPAGAGAVAIAAFALSRRDGVPEQPEPGNRPLIVA